jgi:uncharacterized protein YccT (UPF0319 family)
MLANDIANLTMTTKNTIQNIRNDALLLRKKTEAEEAGVKAEIEIDDRSAELQAKRIESEADIMRKRGYVTAARYNSEARQYRRSATSSLVGGFAGATSTLLGAWGDWRKLNPAVGSSKVSSGYTYSNPPDMDING